MQKILIIQTAFIGDVVLATAMVEKLHHYFPQASIDFLVRKGNEGLLLNNPWLKEVIIWDKKKRKIPNLFSVIRKVRASHYDLVINLQRFFATGLITALSGAKQTRGFDKNPLSFFFSRKVAHTINTKHPIHEVERNNQLINDLTSNISFLPKLYPSNQDELFVDRYRSGRYITMTPASVWFTKQYPREKWLDLINDLPPYMIYLLGGKENAEENETICKLAANKNIESLAGKLSFLQSAALMRTAVMNYVNDSAPLHFASAVDAPVTAIFCSTVPAFGYTPLSKISFIVETKEKLGCRPCGLHGKKKCPLGHFNCAYSINTIQLIEPINSNAV